MMNNESSFSKDLLIEEEVSAWLHKYYYSTNFFEEVVDINQSDLQHKGVDVAQTSFEIYKDRLAHAVDEKCAIKYVKRNHKEGKLPTFAFELNYEKDQQLLDGWLFGDKYSNTGREKYLIIFHIVHR